MKVLSLTVTLLHTKDYIWRPSISYKSNINSLIVIQYVLLMESVIFMWPPFTHSQSLILLRKSRNYEQNDTFDHIVLLSFSQFFLPEKNFDVLFLNNAFTVEVKSKGLIQTQLRALVINIYICPWHRPSSRQNLSCPAVQKNMLARPSSL